MFFLCELTSIKSYVFNQQFSLAVRFKKGEVSTEKQSWPELELEETVDLKTQGTYLGLIPKINSICQLVISSVYYHCHVAIKNKPGSESILILLILLVSFINLITGLLTAISKKNAIKNSYWAKLLSGILTLFFSVWMTVDIGLDIYN